MKRKVSASKKPKVSTAKERLTDAAIRHAAPGAYHDGKGLYLIVRGGARNWVLRYTLHGKAHTMGLGAYPVIGLAAARDRAKAAREVKADNADPIVVRREKRAVERTEEFAKTMTFDRCAEQYQIDHAADWSNEKVKWQWSYALREFASPIIGKLPVVTIGVVDVRKVLMQPHPKLKTPLWEAIPETAHKLRIKIEKVLEWAKVQKYRSGDNPATWKGNLTHVLAKPNRGTTGHAWLPYGDLPGFMVKLREQNITSARALEFLILNNARSNEVRGAQWREFDLANRMWTVPKERMKSRKEHRRPLSDRSMAILAEMQLRGHDPDALVFPGASDKPMSDMTLAMLVRRLGYGVTVHGFRKTFSTWGRDKSKPFEAVEMALAHDVGNEVERIYQRSDMFEHRHQLADDWSAYCTTP